MYDWRSEILVFSLLNFARLLYIKNCLGSLHVFIPETDYSYTTIWEEVVFLPYADLV